jgi:hypothetical protein
MGIFRKQPFMCGGCGKTVTAKITVPPSKARDPLAPPPGWGDATLTAQHPVFGALAVLVVYACTEECAGKMALGEGPGMALIAKFQTAFAEQATHEVAPVETPVEPEKAPEQS